MKIFDFKKNGTHSVCPVLLPCSSETPFHRSGAQPHENDSLLLSWDPATAWELDFSTAGLNTWQDHQWCPLEKTPSEYHKKGLY